MLLYLSTNTCPDIAFVMSQVEHFSHNCKKSHANAVKMIICYPKKTADWGTIVQPTGKVHLETWFDSIFAVLFCHDSDKSLSTVKSNIGYIIWLGGSPLIWNSILQTKIFLSIFAAEYLALSQCMQAVIAIQNYWRKLWWSSIFLMRSYLPLDAKSLKTIKVLSFLPCNSISPITQNISLSMASFLVPYVQQGKQGWNDWDLESRVHGAVSWPPYKRTCLWALQAYLLFGARIVITIISSVGFACS